MQKVISYFPGQAYGLTPDWTPVQTVIECSMSEGIGIHLVGLSDISIKESLLRVVTALQSVGYKFPGKKVIINIVPRIEHDTNALDLPIALAILLESGQIKPKDPTRIYAAIGELGLDGSVRFVNRAAQIVQLASDNGVESILVPMVNKKQGTDFIMDDKSIIGVSNIVEAIRFVESDKLSE